MDDRSCHDSGGGRRGCSVRLKLRDRGGTELNKEIVSVGNVEKKDRGKVYLRRVGTSRVEMVFVQQVR